MAVRQHAETVGEGLKHPPAGFVGAARLCVAMHGVTDPGHSLACSLDSRDKRRQLGPQLRLTHAHNDCQPTWRVLWVERVDHGHKIVGVHLVADFHTDGVANPSHELHVGGVKLPCALATPQEVAYKAHSALL